MHVTRAVCSMFCVHVCVSVCVSVQSRQRLNRVRVSFVSVHSCRRAAVCFEGTLLQLQSALTLLLPTNLPDFHRNIYSAHYCTFAQ